MNLSRIMLAFALLTTSASSAASLPQQAVLQMNHDVTVVFTDPVVPMPDAHGVFQASLRPSAKLFGMTLTTRPTLVVKANGHTLALNVNSAHATIDGRETLLPSRIRQVGPEYVVPIAAIVRLLGYAVTWDQTTRVLNIGGPLGRPINTVQVTGFDVLTGRPSALLRYGAIAVEAGRDAQHPTRVTVTLVNRSRAAVGRGQTALKLLSVSTAIGLQQISGYGMYDLVAPAVPVAGRLTYAGTFNARPTYILARLTP